MIDTEAHPNETRTLGDIHKDCIAAVTHGRKPVVSAVWLSTAVGVNIQIAEFMLAKLEEADIVGPVDELGCHTVLTPCVPPVDRHARWVQDQSGHTLTPDEARCVLTLCSIATGPHNIHLAGGWTGGVTWHGDSVCVRMVHPSDLGTTDMDGLTALVLAAHRHAVRVSISPRSNTSLEVWLHARLSADDPSPERGLRHPTLRDLAVRALAGSAANVSGPDGTASAI
jgi:hypothetical protein